MRDHTLPVLRNETKDEDEFPSIKWRLGRLHESFPNPANYVIKVAEFRTIFKPQRITKKSAPWEKAYIAGLVDAKGSLGIYPRHSKGSVKQQLMTVISLCSHDIGDLRMVQERYGGVIKLAGRNKEKNATIYRLVIHSKRDIVFLMTDIRRYLIAKSSIADLLWKYCQSRLEALECAENPFQAPITEEERAVAQELIRVNKLFLHAKQSL